MSTLNLAYKVMDESTMRPETLSSSLPVHVYDVPCQVERDEKRKIYTITIGMSHTSCFFLEGLSSIFSPDHNIYDYDHDLIIFAFKTFSQ